MNSSEKYAFVDECGNTNIDTSLANVSTHYVITALIVDADQIIPIRDAFERVRSIHFQTGEMKSRLVKNNDERRCNILRDISNLSFRIYCLVVDKRELKSKGYEYADVFFKNFNAKLYRILFRDFPVLNVVADEYKTTEFMQSFRNYVSKRFMPELFRKISVRFVDSKSEILVQGADFISGSISRYFDEKLKSSNSEEFLRILDSRIYAIETFPPIYLPYTVRLEEYTESPFGKLIEKESLIKATNFIQQYDDTSDPIRRDQLLCVKLLLNHHFFHPKTFLPTERLRTELNETRPETLSEHGLRTTVIAGLRDEEVLIASSIHGGYKLPSSMNDILEFMNMASSQIVPFLQRVQRCRRSLWRASDGKLDILEQEEYRTLREALPNLNVGADPSISS